MKTIPQVAVAGIGGFASSHHTALQELEVGKALRVSATCDPREHELKALKEQFDFSGRSVGVFDDFTTMLETAACDWVSLATPITLHAPMHAECVRRGLPCYLEKPPTLDPAELEAMIALDTEAKRQTQVGFMYMYEPERLQLKARLLSGEFGKLLRVSIRGAWMRPQSYYARNSWAGRLRHGGALVLDSCMGNAMAHHVHNVLFFAGVGRMDSWGGCRQVEARLFRANEIEGVDTVFLRGELDGAVEIRLALTHACDTKWISEERLTCEKAVITLHPQQKIVIQYNGGACETLSIAPRSYLRENLRLYSEYATGTPHQLLSTLEDCRPFVQLNALAYLSTGRIHPIAPPVSEFTGNYWKISGIESLLEEFVNTGDFSLLHPLDPLGHTPIPVRPSDLERLSQAVTELALPESR